MAEVKNIAGTATRRLAPKWLKKAEDRRPCGHQGCKNEGHFIPNLTIWGKDDPVRSKRFAVMVIPIVFCAEHATQDPKEFVPDAQMQASIRDLLGNDESGNAREPDLETMAVRYVGNERCAVKRAEEVSAQSAGAWSRQFNESTGKVEYVKK